MGILGVEKVSLWLEEPDSGDVEAVAVWAEVEAHRLSVLGHRFSNEQARPFVRGDEPYVLAPEQYEHVPGAAELAAGRHLAFAPFTFDGGHIGFLVAGDSDPAVFDGLALKMLAGLANQAKLAIAGAR